MATTQQVQQLYIGLLGRAADQAGLNFWINDIASGNRTLDDVQAAFSASPEFQATYGSITDRATLVSTIYNNLFERAPDAEGLAYWVGTSLTADQLIAGFLQFASPADRTVLNNKVLVAEVYTNVAADTGFNVADAASVIATVNGSLASVTAALGTVSTQPGIALPATVATIKAVETTAAQKLAYETNAANIKALVDLNAKAVVLGAAPIADIDNNSKFDWNEAFPALASAIAVRGTLSPDATNIVELDFTNKTSAYTAAKQALVTTLPNGNALVNAFEQTFAADNAAKPANGSAVTAAKADLEALAVGQPVAWSAALTASGVTGLTTAASVYAFLADSTKPASDVAALKTAITASALSNAAKTAYDAAAALAAVDRADDAASKAYTAASTALSKAATDAIPGTPDAVESAKSAYDTNFAAFVAAKQLLDGVKAADALKAEATDLKAAYDAVSTAASNAVTALGVSTVAKDVAVAGTAGADVFYFATPAADNIDYAALGLTAGDKLYVGQGFAFNSGALSAGNNNALEFFLVKNGNNVDVVIEKTAFGSATAVVSVAGVVNATADNDGVAVITLTGVSVDQLQVANGVISYVA